MKIEILQKKKDLESLDMCNFTSQNRLSDEYVKDIRDPRIHDCLLSIQIRKRKKKIPTTTFLPFLGFLLVQVFNQTRFVSLNLPTLTETLILGVPMGFLKSEEELEVTGEDSKDVILYVNGVRKVLPDGLAHLTLLEYLRGKRKHIN